MKLIQGWRDALNRLWSVRIAIFTALLGVADPILALFQAQVPPLVYSVLCAAIIIARVLQQPDPEATIPGK
jgi:hypothetical protein